MSDHVLIPDGIDPTGTYTHPHFPEQIVTLRHPTTGSVWLMTPGYAAQLAAQLTERVKATETTQRPVLRFEGDHRTHFYGDGCPEEHGRSQLTDCPGPTRTED